MYGLAGRDLAERVEATLEVVGLTERAGDKVADYSGGMQRRLNIAAGMLHRPRLLVLDEPTVGVDPQSRNAILGNVEALGGQGIAVLYTTHYMEEAERLCDRVGIIDQGRLIAEGTRRELVARVGERDRIELTATGDLAELAAAAARVEGVDEASVVAAASTWSPGRLAHCCRGCWRRPSRPGPRWPASSWSSPTWRPSST
jgi:linearmycin/streptolysin S transport system ATP-binding protein